MHKQNKVTVGIDYSYTCPAMCIHTGDQWSWDNCKVFFLSQTKKYEGSFGLNIKGIPYPQNYSTDEERYDKISNIFIDIIAESQPDLVSIEGYSYGSSGSKVFNIAENGGLIKHKLFKLKYNIIKPAPSEVKKFATGKGNSNKEVMFDFFNEEVKKTLHIKEKMCYNKKSITTPIGDIVDSYYICKHAFFKENTAK